MDTDSQYGAPPPTPQNEPEAPQRHPFKNKRVYSFIGIALALVFIAGALSYLAAKKFTPAEPEPEVVVLSQKELVQSYTSELVSKAQELKDTDSAETARQLNDIAIKRRDALKELMSEDTKAFLMLVEPNGFADKVPAEVASNTEKKVKVSGKLKVRVLDTFGGSDGKDHEIKAEYQYSLMDTKGNEARLHLPDDLNSKFYDKNVSVEAIELGGEYAAQTSAVNLVDESAGAAVESEAVILNKTVAVVLLNFSTNTTQPFTKTQIQTSYFGTTGQSVTQYYKEATNNQINITGSVYGYYTISSSTSSCLPDEWAAAAKAKAAAAGVNLDSFNHVSYVFPKVAACTWGGIGHMPGRITWINGLGTNLMITTHELGHNFGLHHAQATTCTSGTTKVMVGGTCTTAEYADSHDVMGNATPVRHMAAFRKLHLGVMPSANIITATSGDHTITPIERATTSKQVLRVPRDRDAAGNALNYYYVDYRQPYGLFDNYTAGSNPVSGVMIRVAPNPSIALTQLLDATPGTTGGFLDASLTTGRSFYDSARNIRITTKSVSTTGAVVNVTAPTVASTCTRLPATLTAQPTSQWANAGGSLRYILTVRSNDSAGCAASSFPVAVTVPTGFTKTVSPVSLSLAPGASGSVTLTATSATTTAPGAYSLKASVGNGSATTNVATTTVAYNIYDQTAIPPTVSISSPTANTQLIGRVMINASARPASGKSIKKIDIYVNQVLVHSVTNTSSVSYTLNTNKLKMSGTVPITVRAYDSSNAVGTATVNTVK